MTALHDRIPNWDHEAHVLSVRRQMLACNPLALDRAKRRAKAYPRFMRIKRASVSYRGGVL